MVMLVFGVLSAVFAGVPMFSFLLLVWWLDRHDREPLWLLLLTFAWGAIGSVMLALAGSTAVVGALGSLFGASQAETWSAVLVAPPIEEPTKALILFAVMYSRHFDNATDGFVYGAATGFGFAMTENFLYFTQYADPGHLFEWFQLVVIRTFYSGVMHACASSTVGAALGWARFRGIGARLLALPVGFGAAMGIHALWNGLLTLDEIWDTTFWSQINFALFPLEAAFLFGLFQLALWEERAVIRRELADEVQQGLLPLRHASAIASWWRRRNGDWLPKGVPHWPYVRAATTLAMRKHQCRNASKRTYAFYADEVARLRREVKGLLALGATPELASKA